MEYKTFKCDIDGCDKPNARRFVFPCVDRRPRQIAEETLNELETPGAVDLCDGHFPRVFDALLRRCGTMAEQRAAWKEILGAK